MSFKRALFWFLAACLLIMAAIIQIRAGNAGDKNWLLLAAREWLDGRKLDVEVIEVNPPLIIWLYAIPVGIAMHVLPVSDFKVLASLGLVICTLSVWLGLLLIRRHPEFFAHPEKQKYFALLLSSVFVLFAHQIYFFDRDHIFLVMTFPYLLRFMPTLARQKIPITLRLAVGVFAAVGFCIKPHTLIVFGAVQGLVILRERRIAIFSSLENLIIYGAALVYFFCVWTFTPEYLTVIMPMAALTYGAYRAKLGVYLYLSIAALSAGVTFVDFRLRDVTPYRKDSLYFMGISLAFLGYALAGNGWGYTYNPLLCMLIFMSGWMLWDYGWLKQNARLHKQNASRFICGQYGCISNIALNLIYSILCIAMFFSSAECDVRMECNKNQSYINYITTHNVRSFGALSMNLRTWPSIARVSGAVWEMRFNHLWMLPALLQKGERFQTAHHWIIDYTGEGLAEDLDKRKPDIVFVDASDAIFGYPHPVDMIGFFSSVPRFRQAWRNYHYAATIDHCAPTAPKDISAPQTDCRYAIYQRTD